MMRKVFGIAFFLLISVFGVVCAQEIDVRVMNEEIIRRGNTSYNILHLYVGNDGLSDFGLAESYANRTIPIIRGICNHLQETKFISGVDQTSLQKIELDQFDWDLDLADWVGEHPIFGWWNPTTDWHVIQYGNKIYLINGREGFRGDIYRINIKE